MCIKVFFSLQQSNHSVSSLGRRSFSHRANFFSGLFCDRRDGGTDGRTAWIGWRHRISCLLSGMNMYVRCPKGHIDDRGPGLYEGQSIPIHSLFTIMALNFIYAFSHIQRR